MFESVVIAPRGCLSVGGYDTRFDFGHLAETLVFYDKVTLVGEPHEVGSLIVNMGADAFLELHGSGRIAVVPTYCQSGYGDNRDELVFNSSRLFWGIAPLDMLEANLRLIEIKTRKAVLDAVAGSGALALISDLALRNANEALRAQAGDDTHFVEGIAKAILKYRNPGEEDAIRFVSGRLGIDRDLGERHGAPRVDEFGNFEHWEELMRLWKSGAHTVPLRPIGLIHEMAKFLSWFDSALLMKAEFSVDPPLADGITQQINRTTAKLFPASDLSLFQEIVFSDARAIGQPVSNASMEERKQQFLNLATLLGQKERFSRWLKAQPPDRLLLQSYMDYIRHGTWVDKLPGKTVRFLIFSGAGVLADIALTAAAGMPGVGTAGGLAIGAFDSLVLDNLREGWRPSQFIDGPLTKWVGRAKEGRA